MPAKKPATKSGAKKKPTSRPAPSTKPVWQKLFIKPGTVMTWNAPKGHKDWLTGSKTAVLTRDNVLDQRGNDAQVENAWLFVENMEDLNFYVTHFAAHLTPTTNMIVSYKKGNKEVHRDTVREAMKTLGYESISLVAVDETWSGMRFKRA